MWWLSKNYILAVKYRGENRRIESKCVVGHVSTKKCNTCNNTFDVVEFYVFKTKNRKVAYYSSDCKRCFIDKRINQYKNDTEFKSKKRLYDAEYNKINPDKAKIRRDKWRLNNPEYENENKSEYFRNYYQRTLPKLASNIRCSVRNSLNKNGFSKKSKTELIIGMDFKSFKEYLESKFEPWMNWDNYGKYNGELNFGWDIDHIIPISSAKSEDEVIKLNHYTNLQPLCSKYNRYIKKNIIQQVDKNNI